MNKLDPSLMISFKKAILWKDKTQLQKLVDEGYLIPLPKHSMCEPGECFKCDWDSCDWINRFYLIKKIIQKFINRNLQ